jgi:hypothetical protein
LALLIIAIVAALIVLAARAGADPGSGADPDVAGAAASGEPRPQPSESEPDPESEALGPDLDGHAVSMPSGPPSRPTWLGALDLSLGWRRQLTDTDNDARNELWVVLTWRR